ncbi:MAG: prepilin peptidase [Hyphomicrobium sp.]|nr:prepilin peptidase [Hyphomicrobium sp.]PPD06427.1 MAG: prepilin peptidase [Hyphomicrobium sp.]
MSVQGSSLNLAVPAGMTAAVLIAAYAGIAVPAFAWGAARPATEIVAGAVLAAGLIAGSVIDLRTLRLPDWVTLPLAAAGIIIAHVLAWVDGLERLLAAVTGFVILALVRDVYFRWRQRHGLGLGDAKLLAAAGAWTGLAALPAVVLWACALALAAVAAWASSGQRVTSATAIPFGPFLAAGTWIVWLYGPPL